eukprot:762949-Hanusia_phi.AAC.14
MKRRGERSGWEGEGGEDRGQHLFFYMKASFIKQDTSVSTSPYPPTRGKSTWPAIGQGGRSLLPP